MRHMGWRPPLGVDHHLLAGDDVELVGHERLHQVPRQVFLARERRHLRDAPAFVGVAVGGRQPWLRAATSLALNSSLLMPVCCAPMSCMSRPKMPANLARSQALPPAASSGNVVVDLAGGHGEPPRFVLNQDAAGAAASSCD
jgi:hypothetical protein